MRYRPKRVPLSLSALAALLLSASLAMPSPAFAGDKNASSAAAKEGAGHFKGKRFIEAARRFEEAYRLNPVDPRNLRYAGRAWQEVGHVERALGLFERYHQVETNPKHRATIVPHIETLKAIPAPKRADMLAQATINYPQGKLELEAGRAMERLGDEVSLQRALKLFGTARLWATTPAEQSAVDAAIDQAKRQQVALKENAAAKEKAAKDKAAMEKAAKDAAAGDNGDPGGGANKGGAGSMGVAKTGTSDGMKSGLMIGGGAVALVGVALAVYGIMAVRTADADYQEDGTVADPNMWSYGSPDEYESDRSFNSSLYYAGLATAGVGVGVLVWGILRPAATATSWHAAPLVDANHRGLLVGLRF